MGITVVNTTIGGAMGGITAMTITWIQNREPDLGMTINRTLAGLVAITAPSGFARPVLAVVIGTLSDIVVVYAVSFVEKVLKVDDPVGAISVHGFNGALGQVYGGPFADGTMNYNGTDIKGIFFGDASQLVAQIIGMVTAFVWAFGISFIFFKLLDMFLRPR